MSQQENESLEAAFSKLIQTTKDGIGEIQDAFREANTFRRNTGKHRARDYVGNPHNLICFTGNTLYFNLIEEDIRKIYQKHELDNAGVLGSYLTITSDKNSYIIEIETYTQKGKKAFKSQIQFNVLSIELLPQDIEEELKKSGSVRLLLEIE